jgi:hypothetical protein
MTINGTGLVDIKAVKDVLDLRENSLLGTHVPFGKLEFVYLQNA